MEKLEKAIIYTIGAYCIISVINPAPLYYMDMPLGVVAGVLCARWSISKINLKDYIWLYLGLIILANIKDELGLVMTGLCILFFTICNIIRYYSGVKEQRKVNFVKLLPNIVLFVCYIIFAVQSNMVMELLSNLMVIIGSLKIVLSIIAIIVIMILLLIFKPWTKIELTKVKKYYGVIIGVVAIVLGLILYKAASIFYSSLPFSLQKTFVNAINALYNKGYFGKRVYILTALFVIFIFLLCIILVKKKSVKPFIIQSSAIFIMIFVYSVALAIGFVFEKEAVFREGLSNLHRYYAPIFILGAIWILSRVLDGDIEYKIDKAPIIASLLVMIVLVKELPAPGAVLYNNME